VKDEKFTELIKMMQPYYDSANYAYLRGGAFQKFNSLQDSKKIKDGDSVVYIGSKSKASAEAILTWADVEILSAKELRAKVKKETKH